MSTKKIKTLFSKAFQAFLSGRGQDAINDRRNK
jgi:hypothetical protein